MIRATQISSLTPMRGIAAIWVMLFHLDVALFYRDLGPLLDHDLTALLQKGYLWVDFFFLLSGFIIAHVYAERLSLEKDLPSCARYLWSRLTRIYPLHLFTLLLVVIFTEASVVLYPQVVDGSWNTYFDWQAMPSNLLLTHSMNQHFYLSWNMASWSIGAEWWAYVIAIPVLIWFSQNKNTTSVCILFACFIALACLYKFYGNDSLDITYNYGFFRCFIEFTMGVMVYQFYKQSTWSVALGKDTAFFLLMTGIVINLHWNVNDLITIPLFLLLIMALAYNRGTVKSCLQLSAFQYIGKISYSIYLVHSLWFLVYWFTLPHLDLPLTEGELPGFSKLIYVSSFIFLTISCSHFTYRYVELACRKALRRLVKV